MKFQKSKQTANKVAKISKNAPVKKQISADRFFF